MTTGFVKHLKCQDEDNLRVQERGLGLHFKKLKLLGFHIGNFSGESLCV